MAYRVGSFLFDTEEEAKAAKNEAQAIAYIVNQIDMRNPKAILAAYEQIVEKNLFHTTLGIAFLNEMKSGELSSQNMQWDTIPEISFVDEKADSPGESRILEEKQKTSSNKKRARNSVDSYELKKYKKLSEILGVACVTMLLIIVGMFWVLSTSNKPTILNYEEKIIDKYASWEEELNEREQALREKE